MRPSKPYPEFPLYAHAAGKWAKKIQGKTVYFGSWDDPNGALEAYHRLIGGEEPEKPERPAAGLSIQEACNAFLTAKELAREDVAWSPPRGSQSHDGTGGHRGGIVVRFGYALYQKP